MISINNINKDAINIDMIVNTFETNNDKKYINIEKKYKEKYNKLGYYRLIKPEEYKTELRTGDIIRYSKKYDKISCACIITKIIRLGENINETIKKNTIKKNTIKKNTIKKINNISLNIGPINNSNDDVKYILLEALANKKSYWKIYPENFFIFLYDKSTNKLRRQFYRAGIKDDDDDDDKNGLNFDILIDADPTIKNRIKRQNLLTEKQQKLLKDVDDVIEKYDKQNYKKSKLTSDDIMKMGE